MRTSRTLLVLAALSVADFATPASQASAQALGPQRQFIALEPYYARLELDRGKDVSRLGLNGYGARLWINLAPFSGPANNLVGKGAIALFATYTPDQGENGFTTLHYGAQHDVFFVNRPLGGFIDPLLSVAGGAFRTKATGTDESETRFALTPGLGIRIPVANRLQIRADARDIIVFGSRMGPGGEKRTANSYEFTGALGITF